MTGLDTNVLVRYIMQDDRTQSAKATKLIEALTLNKPGFVSLVSIVELFWVLTKSYSLSRGQVSQALGLLLRTKEIVVDRAEHVAKALRLYSVSSADFADCLIEKISSNLGCERTMTFDIHAAKVTGMTLIK